MADFTEHIAQVAKNIEVLSGVNNLVPNTWDWQVTIGFYAAVHAANAHIACTINHHYRTHGDVKNAINYYVPVNPSKFNEDAYLAYVKLQNYSRRARYLCSDNPHDTSEKAHHISEKHFAKSLRLLNIILEYLESTYKDVKLPKAPIVCNNIKADELSIFPKATS